jgi:hypothetical protein
MKPLSDICGSDVGDYKYVHLLGWDVTKMESFISAN